LAASDAVHSKKESRGCDRNLAIRRHLHTSWGPVSDEFYVGVPRNQ
jgi:hypothetical protein